MKPFSTAYRLATLIAVATAFNALGAAELYKKWDVSYGGLDVDECTAIYPTDDGGFVIAGGSYSSTNGNKASINHGEADYWFIKLDGNGNKEWERVYGGEFYDYPYAVQPTSDGGYLIAGLSDSLTSSNKTSTNHGFDDYWLVKTDEGGNKLWDVVFGGDDFDDCWCLGTASNSYLLAGSSFSGVSGNKMTEHFVTDLYEDGWVVNIDENGEYQWEANIGGNYEDIFYDAQPTADGGWILVGGSASDPYDPNDPSTNGNKMSPYRGDYDGWVVKLAANGDMEWDRSYGGTNTDWFEVSIPIDDGYIVGGYSYSSDTTPPSNKTSPNFGLGFSDWWILKLDTNGDKIWEKVYGGDRNDYLTSIIPTDDGGYLVFGDTSSGISGNKSTPSLGGNDFWLIKIDAEGNKLWEQAFGGSGSEFAWDTLVKTSDAGYIMGGRSNSGISGNKTASNQGDYDYWIVKTLPVPALSINPAGAGQMSISWTPAYDDWVLQEIADLSSTNWVNAASGTNNPIMLHTTMPSMFYRLSEQ